MEVLKFPVCFGYQVSNYRYIVQVEQMNKNWSGPYASQKTTTYCKSRAHFLLKCAD